MDAPSARELLDRPEVQQALEVAWVDSNSETPERRHEEGGRIFMNVTTGEIMVRRAARGAESWIDLNDPPSLAGCVVVGKFHTHPNPTHEGWGARAERHRLENGCSTRSARLDSSRQRRELFRS